MDTGLRQNIRLKMLDLSENHIFLIQNLSGLAIEALHLAQNQLRNLKGIEDLPNLSVRGFLDRCFCLFVAWLTLSLERCFCRSELSPCHYVQLQSLFSERKDFVLLATTTIVAPNCSTVRRNSGSCG